MRVINIINAKGGVAKTTTAINVACGLADKGYKVLIIDSDPQGNATISIGYYNHESTNDINTVLKNEADIEECIFKTEFKNLDIIPSLNMELILTDKLIFTSVNRESKLSKQLRKVRKLYDYVIIDNSPTFNTITLNTLNAGDDVIIPMTDSLLSDKGKDLTIMQLKELSSIDCLDKQFKIKILFTLVHRGNRPKTKQFIDMTRAKEIDVFNSTIGYQDSLVKEHQINKKMLIQETNKRNKVANDYRLLVEEIEREG